MSKKPPVVTDVAGAAEPRKTLQAQPLVKAKRSLRGEKTVSATFFIPLSTHERLQEIKIKRKTSLQQLFEEAVDQWLANQGATFSFRPEGGQ